MAAKQTQHDADAPFRAIIETLDKSRNQGTLASQVLQELARAYASVSPTSRNRDGWDRRHRNRGVNTSTTDAWSIAARRSSPR